jgi:ABC-type sugar transport system ATPase subunit
LAIWSFPTAASSLRGQPGRFDPGFDLVKDLASSGRVSITVIDYNYAHFFELCDRNNVMQGGRITIDQSVQETSLERLTEMMVSSYRSQLEEVSGDGA